jgi:hypothetical protein
MNVRVYVAHSFQGFDSQACGCVHRRIEGHELGAYDGVSRKAVNGQINAPYGYPGVLQPGCRRCYTEWLTA